MTDTNQPTNFKVVLPSKVQPLEPAPVNPPSPDDEIRSPASLYNRVRDVADKPVNWKKVILIGLAIAAAITIATIVAQRTSIVAPTSAPAAQAAVAPVPKTIEQRVSQIEDWGNDHVAVQFQNMLNDVRTLQAETKALKAEVAVLKNGKPVTKQVSGTVAALLLGTILLLSIGGVLLIGRSRKKSKTA